MVRKLKQHAPLSFFAIWVKYMVVDFLGSVAERQQDSPLGPVLVLVPELEGTSAVGGVDIDVDADVGAEA